MVPEAKSKIKFIERDRISQRTKEALARKVAQGVILGRPKGRKSSHVKLTGKEKEIKLLIKKGVSKSEIGRMFGVNRMTVLKFMKDNGIPSIDMNNRKVKEANNEGH
jgi:DNA invertase Pin-like site-specific DNA recombinase